MQLFFIYWLTEAVLHQFSKMGMDVMLKIKFKRSKPP